jgi:hypothetical protein
MLVVVPQAASVPGAGVVSGLPTSLHAFLLRVDEPVSHQYPRTPTFAWTPTTQRGGHYQFELATSQEFGDSSIVFKDTRVAIPAETIASQLPWMTGEPYALWAHVRWVSANGRKATRWSVPFGFNLRWNDSDVPQQQEAPQGLIRWKPVEGATGYEVLYTDLRPARSFFTTTNVADEREYFTFHSAFGSSATIHWRVRGIRDIGKTASATNGLPAVSYGPWSPIFTTVNTPEADGILRPSGTVSDTWDKVGTKPRAHVLTPALTWTPSAPVISATLNPGSSLYRVYIFTDRNCVNRVFTGSIVGSPAFAPRSQGGPMGLPTGTSALAKIASSTRVVPQGAEGNALDATGVKVTPNETAGGSLTAAAGAAPAAGAASAAGSTAVAGLAQVDLWDSGWPSGRYYWAVVPVTVIPDLDAADAAPVVPGQVVDTPLQYQDTAVPQDECEVGQGMSFGKVSTPVVTSAGKPFVSGVSPSGRSVAAAGVRPVVYASPIVAWQPAIGATNYEIQLSRTPYPWRVAKSLATPSTAIMLPLSRLDVGTWYYRIRGVNTALPKGGQKMSWSSPVSVRITGNQFKLVK